MSAFQDMVAADNKAVFLNSEEFAEVHDVYYDGTNYAQIPVVLTRIKQSSVAVSSSNRMEGVHIVSAMAHISADDLNGIFPEKGQNIEISDGEALGRTFFRKYRYSVSLGQRGSMRGITGISMISKLPVWMKREVLILLYMDI